MELLLRYLFVISILILLPSTQCLAENSGQGSLAPDFELTDLNGKTHRLADYRGKVVIINFWASWCPECLEEMPSLNGLYTKFRNQDLIVLGITSDRKKEPVLEVLQKIPVSYPLLLETGGGVFIRKYIVVGLPTTVLVDRRGFVSERIVGRTDFGSASFSKKIQELLHTGRTP
ncbi:MAG: TlpA disulfide reductase family protein [Thermodesulfovibrionales bacterium]